MKQNEAALFCKILTMNPLKLETDSFLGHTNTLKHTL